MFAIIIFHTFSDCLLNLSLDLDQTACGEVLKYLFVFCFTLQKSTKKDHFLWQLLNIENDTVKTTKELEDEKRSREDLIKDLEIFEYEAGKKKKEQTKYLKEIAIREKKIAEKSNKLDKNVSVFSTFGMGCGS